MYTASQLQAMKELVGRAAAQEVLDGMSVGIGTGSTSLCFLKALIERVRQGVQVQVLCSSLHIRQLAEQAGLPLLDEATTSSLDLYVDGADWVDARYDLIKGGGGALLREKIAAAMSRRFIVIVDDTKMVEDFRGRRLPVEILPFGAASTQQQLTRIGAAPLLRRTADHRPVVTDNGNWIVDIQLPSAVPDPQRFLQRVMQVPGCLAHGLFVGMTSEVFIGEPNGSVQKGHVPR